MSYTELGLKCTGCMGQCGRCEELIQPKQQQQQQQQQPQVTWEFYESRSRELMQQAYKRGRRDGQARLIDSIRSTFGQDFLNMVLDYVLTTETDSEVAG